MTAEATEEELAQVSKRLEELPKEEQRLVNGYRMGLYLDFMMREEMERITPERTGAEKGHNELGRQLANLDKSTSYRGQVEELARRLSEGLENMDFAERRELLHLLVEEIVYDDGQLAIKTIIPLGDCQLRPMAQRACRASAQDPS